MGSKYPGSGNAARPSSLWNRLLHFVPALWVTVETACRKLLQISRAALRLGRTANQPREPGTMEKLKPANLVVSQSGIDFIKRWEGFRRHIYDDGYGNPTIGYGHLVDDDRLVNVTREQAEALLRSRPRSPTCLDAGAGSTINCCFSTFSSSLAGAWRPWRPIWCASGRSWTTAGICRPA